MSPAVKCLILLAVVALLFVTELIPLAITAMGGAIACGLLGFIPAKQEFKKNEIIGASHWREGCYCKSNGARSFP